MNFVTNAIKFTSAGGVNITCTLLKAEQSNECTLEISVKDTGRGMASNEIEKLFNRFSQTTRHISDEYGGSGLGLYISKAVVDLMSGTITVISEPGKGSEFNVTFPVTLASTQPSPDVIPQKTHVKVQSSRTRKGDRLRVLIAEDNKINQKVLLRMLSKSDCDCTAVSDGLQAIEEFRNSGSYDLIFMDVIMPNMDGYECTRVIRQIENERGSGGAFIVGLSGNGRKEYSDLAMDAGMDDFYIKPISAVQIDDLVKSFELEILN
ncbi:hypothetical protein AKO1_013998 [Acrasis kona]|uniref:Uncharacterized protein n=1 Tax=Acrasis kona TaxID=1008807 RepID=A0AAW2Z445_9EUKA